MPAVDNKIIKASKKPPKIVRDEHNRPIRKENGKESFLMSLRKGMGIKKTFGNVKAAVEKEIRKPKSRPIRQPKKNDNNKTGNKGNS